MGQELGRISGVMLKDNLERQGIDLSVDDDLLYLDVNNKSIGINSAATNNSTALFVNSSIKTKDLQVDTKLTLPSIDITTSNNTITARLGDLYLSASDRIVVDNIRTDDLNFDDNTISSTTTNQSIELRPHGTGSVDLSSSLNVTGDISATGDIRIEGTVVFGNNPVEDTVKVLAAVNSDLLPNQNEQFSLGSDNLRWLNVYPNLLNGQAITANSVNTNGINLTLPQGKTWYVSQNGSDTNHGDHEASTFRSIKHAVENPAIASGDTIFVYPGTYEEITPIVIPQGVTLRGQGLRSVKVVPTAGTISNNVFEVNGETTISDITVADFRYDAINDTGYAFSFANNFAVTSRSPYIQNVSVITSGSLTTPNDPKGFASGDAGKGALVDGSKALSTSIEATMLFHSVTFITPGVNALTMTNGVRVEWLNSFVYFADKAMYAIAGVGRYDANRSVTRYGAEVRSIGSACVYGNYGAWAEGQGTLMYLINHNFAYIGAGKDATNDPSLNNKAHEVVMLDTGKIYFQSVDNKGNFSVGDPFTVSFETGTASINGFGLTATGVSSIVLGSATSETVVNAGQVSTGNIKFNSNILTSIAGPVNLIGGTGKINLNVSTVSAKQNIAIDNNFSLKGILTLGNETVDIAKFNAPTDSDILPSVDRKYSLGGDYLLTGIGADQIIPYKRWNKVINQVIKIDSNIQISDNVVQTTQSNSNLELKAHSSGKILLETNNLIIDNQLTVNGTSSTHNVDITGYLHQTGNISQTGDRSISNSAGITGSISATVQANIETITFSQGLINTTASNADLELYAAGTGKIVFPTSSAVLQHNLTVNNTMVANYANITGNVTANLFNNGDITLTANQITTNLANHNLLLEAHGSGKVIAPQANVDIINDLQVNGVSTLGNMSIIGDMLHIGDTYQTGSTIQTGKYDLSHNLTVTQAAQFNNISIVNNNISTTISNSDLEFTAAGTGQVIVPSSNVLIQKDLTVNGLMTAGSATITNTVTSTEFDSPDISFYSNTIITQGLNHNLVLGAHGTGIVSSETSDVTLGQDLQVDGLSTLGNVINIGTAVHTGATNLTGNTTQTGNYILSNNLTVTLDAQFDNIDINNNVITTTDSNSDLELRAAGTGIVNVNDNFRITNNLNVVGVTATTGLTNSGTITSDKFLDGNILITENFITTSTGNLILAPNNNGQVSVANDNVLIDNNLEVDGTSTLGNTVVGKLGSPGTINHTGTLNRTGNVTETGNYDLSNNLTVTGTATLANIDIINNSIATSDSNSDLELRAAGSGKVIFDDVLRIAQAAQIETLVTNGISSSGTITSDVFTDGSILFKDNYFTTIGGADLKLQAPSTKTVYIPFDPLLVNNNLTVVGNTAIKNAVINGNILHTGSKTQTGNVIQTGNASISANLTVTGTTALFPDVSIINNVIKTLSTNSDLELRAAGTGVIRAAYDNVAISQRLTVNGTTATSTINNSGTVYSDQFTDGDIVIKDNYITTTSGTSNLRLVGAGLGGAKLEKTKFNSNTISTESLNDNIVLTVSSGSVVVTGTNALKIPVGTAAARLSNNSGDIRLDTTDTLFSGWNGARVTFGGLYSTDRRTTVSAHPTNNTINFVTNTVTSMTLTETALTPNALLVNNNLYFNNNTISATTANSNVYLSPNGAGSLILENIAIHEDTITNLKSTAPLVLQNTGFGYFAFSGSGGIAIPAGPTITNPPPGTELGDFRFNTTLSTAEIFNGIEYVSLSGGGNTGQITADQVQEITNLWGLILG